MKKGCERVLDRQNDSILGTEQIKNEDAEMEFPSLVLSTAFANLLGLRGTLVEESLQIIDCSRFAKSFCLLQKEPRI